MGLFDGVDVSTQPSLKRIAKKVLQDRADLLLELHTELLAKFGSNETVRHVLYKAQDILAEKDKIK